ncbi:NmrA family transcriptional regulator [Alteromonas gilva]|uniref:NmrA family transcriptional regulator n=1 Tax=Alteromonas gilva TaxID=2987522 RepID=A0ABT5L1W1_9ALTE|nr:NmrA family transcriptional regulator [Alteromonas gilva]MDC8829793.1 NmrA family transcriptional regulator [Alteromonas gilva]
MTTHHQLSWRYLVLGKQGKTGRRVCQQLERLGASVTGVSRTTMPAFHWQDKTLVWQNLFAGFDAIYITYQPDLAVPMAAQDIARLTIAARQAGVKQLVLLSGRGEPGAQEAEQILAQSGLHHHVIRASWFNQNFSEGFIAEMVARGQVMLPQGHMPEPFIDANDIAEAVVQCLTNPAIEPGIYEVTGPQLLTFSRCIEMIAQQLGRPVGFCDVEVDDFLAVLKEQGATDDVLWLMKTLFSDVLDGRNNYTTDVLEQLLGRPATTFSEYVSKAFGQPLSALPASVE